MPMPESKITMRPLASSSINAFGYDPASKTLAVEFKGGLRYHYEGVSQAEADGLASAKSAGQYVNSLVRGRAAKAQETPGQAHERAVRQRTQRPVRTRGGR